MAHGSNTPHRTSVGETTDTSRSDNGHQSEWQRTSVGVTTDTSRSDNIQLTNHAINLVNMQNLSLSNNSGHRIFFKLFFHVLLLKLTSTNVCRNCKTDESCFLHNVHSCVPNRWQQRFDCHFMCFTVWQKTTEDFQGHSWRLITGSI